ncbi:MAG TPA: hypothetical protein VM240_10035 [Verrucomicrobiae bacterium]|nr:hypothetical protein [Verrucomicrobiae bacterium]
MAHEVPWSNLKLASPVETYWKEYGLPLKGEYGGQCYHLTCTRGSADWYNKSSGRYFCDPCARAINEICLAQGQKKLCELHV